jgi:hypothetical protein
MQWLSPGSGLTLSPAAAASADATNRARAALANLVGVGATAH